MASLGTQKPSKSRSIMVSIEKQWTPSLGVPANRVPHFLNFLNLKYILLYKYELKKINYKYKEPEKSRLQLMMQFVLWKATPDLQQVFDFDAICPLRIAAVAQQKVGTNLSFDMVLKDHGTRFCNGWVLAELFMHKKTNSVWFWLFHNKDCIFFYSQAGTLGLERRNFLSIWWFL